MNSSQGGRRISVKTFGCKVAGLWRRRSVIPGEVTRAVAEEVGKGAAVMLLCWPTGPRGYRLELVTGPEVEGMARRWETWEPSTGSKRR